MSVVVLPDPVPPDTKTLSLASTQARRKSNISGVAVPNRMRSSTPTGQAGNFRTVIARPDQRERLDDGVDAGAVLEAGVDRGLDPSMRRPSGVMMRSMMRSTCSLFRKWLSTRWIFPARSM